MRRAAPERSQAPEEFQDLYPHVLTCSKCGFCQANCPIFRATGHEGHVARGKVALYRNIIEDHTEIGPDVKDAFANCLLCRACIENCVPAIRTDDVVVSFRHAYAERFGRGLLQRWVFRTLLPRPRLMRALVRVVWALRKTRLIDLARRIGLVGLLNPKLDRALELGAEKPGQLLTSRLADRTAPESDGRSLLGYWISCGYNYVLPQVGESTVRVLERMGFAVEVLDNCCCGLPAYGYGDLEAAGALARENLGRLGDLERFEAIVSDCGSCSGHLKEYARILADDPKWSARAKRLESKIRSFSEFVVERGGLEALLGTDQVGAATTSEARVTNEADLKRGAGSTVTFHEPCHLGRRYQNVVDQPRRILRSLPGFTFKELEEADSCCGAAGTYGVMHPETSAAILDRKMENVRSTGASVVATECPSCMMQLKLGAQRAGLPVSVLGISQLCDKATEPAPQSTTGPVAGSERE
jgi:glycolate oxidase iron-sulfur subunit